MDRSTFILSALALAAAAPAPGTSLAFGTEAGTRLRKTVEMKSELVLEDFDMALNGEAIEVEAPEMTMVSRTALTVVDTYDRVAGGRPLELRRRYESLEETEALRGTPNIDESSESSSPLEGRTLAFTWDPEEELYRASFADEDEARDELLVDVEGQLDFLGLLPAGEVEEGDTWTLEAAAMNDALALGGELHFESDEPEEEEDRLIQEAMEENLEGTLTCTFAGMREQDGRRLAVVTLAFEGSGEARSEPDEGLVDERAVRLTVDLEGQLLWDTAAGHAASLEFGGDVELSLTESTVQVTVEQAMEQELTLTFGGMIVIAVSFESL